MPALTFTPPFWASDPDDQPVRCAAPPAEPAPEPGPSDPAPELDTSYDDVAGQEQGNVPDPSDPDYQ